MSDGHCRHNVGKHKLSLKGDDFRVVQRQVVLIRMKNRMLNTCICMPMSDSVQLVVQIDCKIRNDLHSKTVVVEKADMFDLNRGQIMEAWSDELNDLHSHAAGQRVFGGGASLRDFFSHAERLVSVRKIRRGLHRKVDESYDEGFEDTKTHGVCPAAKFSAAGSLFMHAVMAQLGSSHNKLPMDREFLDRITNNNRLFLTTMLCGLWAGDGSSYHATNANVIISATNDRDSFYDLIKEWAHFLELFFGLQDGFKKIRLKNEKITLTNIKFYLWMRLDLDALHHQQK